MRCVHMGSTNKMIARTLGISEGTVKIHLTSIFQQLGAPNRAAAVALYNGWLTNHLQVLRNGEGTARPVMGQAGVVPLRRHKPRRFQYPLPAERHERPAADGSRAQHALWRRAARHADDEAGSTRLKQMSTAARANASTRTLRRRLRRLAWNPLTPFLAQRVI